VAFQRRRTQANTDFLPLHLHRVIVISCVLRDDEGVRVFSIGEPERDERATIQRFFDGIEKLTPQLVSWNGGGFDLPVLQLRGMIHGVTAPRYWDLGDEDRDFRYNNYLGRYHTRHCDLMDLMGLYQPRNNAPLDEVAQLAGLPGKIGLSGGGVWGEYLAGGIAADPRVLRGRLRQYLSSVAPLPENARRPLVRAARGRVHTAARLDRHAADPVLARVPEPLAERLTLDVTRWTPRAAASRATPKARSCSSKVRCPARPSKRSRCTASALSMSRAPSRSCTNRRRAASRAARTSAPAAAVRPSTSTRAPRSPQSSAGWRIAWRGLARYKSARCCPRSTARNGAIGAARGFRSATSHRRGRWSVFASAAQRTSPICGAVTYCRRRCLR
jgi:predicted PolB exonuclease-like 3'-5' exonuclease